jgi:hypothetical protein
MYGDLIPISWATVTAYGPVEAYTSSLDGFYQMWLPTGKYMIAAASPGYTTQGAEVQLSLGSVTPMDINLKYPSEPLPELQGGGLILAISLIMVYALQRRRSCADQE